MLVTLVEFGRIKLMKRDEQVDDGSDSLFYFEDGMIS
jgi:hypothetical protein